MKQSGIAILSLILLSNAAEAGGGKQFIKSLGKTAAHTAVGVATGVVVGTVVHPAMSKEQEPAQPQVVYIQAPPQTAEVQTSHEQTPVTAPAPPPMTIEQVAEAKRAAAAAQQAAADAEKKAAAAKKEAEKQAADQRTFADFWPVAERYVHQAESASTLAQPYLSQIGFCMKQQIQSVVEKFKHDMPADFPQDKYKSDAQAKAKEIALKHCANLVETAVQNRPAMVQNRDALAHTIALDMAVKVPKKFATAIPILTGEMKLDSCLKQIEATWPSVESEKNGYPKSVVENAHLVACSLGKFAGEITCAPSDRYEQYGKSMCRNPQIRSSANASAVETSLALQSYKALSFKGLF
jgi:nucleoid-associated protein YgaU